MKENCEKENFLKLMTFYQNHTVVYYQHWVTHLNKIRVHQPNLFMIYADPDSQS
jgi:hypothetical protein